jgi:hypothetical protein
MTTLFDATLALAQVVGEVSTGVATGGSTTTLVDTTRTDTVDYWNDGTIFFRGGNNASKSAVITDWALTGTTFTFATQTGACAATNLYTVCLASFTREDLRQAINLALADMGRVLKIDSSLVGVASQLAYDLPAGVTDPIRVMVDDVPNYHWNTAWGDGHLVFDSGKEPVAGGMISIWYMADHTVLTADADVITGIPLERLKAEAAVIAYNAYLERLGSANNAQALRQKDFEAKLQQARARYPLHTIAHDPHHASY